MYPLIVLAILMPTLYFDTALGFFGLSFYGLLAVAGTMAVLQQRLELRTADAVKYVLFAGLVIASLVMGMMFHPVTAHSIKNVLVILLSALAAFSLVPVMARYPALVVRGLRVVIVLHVAVFLAQLVLWYGAGVDLDIGGLMGGAGHRAFYTNDIYRATGVFDEPALYALFMLGLCVCLYLYEGRLSRWTLAGLLTLPLTLSFAAFALFGLVLALMRLRLWVLLGVVLAVSYPVLANLPVSSDMVAAVVDRLGDLTDNQDGSTQAKALVVADLLDDRATLLFGFGLEGFRPESLDTYFEAMYDLTLPGSSITAFGLVFGIPIFLVYCAFFAGRLGWRALAMVGVLLIKLSVYHMPFLWLVTALLMACPRALARHRPPLAAPPATALLPVAS